MATATAINSLSNGQSTTALADLTASRNDGKVHLLLAASGSVATIKIPNIIQSLLHAHQQTNNSSSPSPSLSIRLILTSSAANFLAGQSPEQPSFQSLLSTPGLDGIYLDDDEWGRGASIGPAEGAWRRGASILHIELRRWAHLLAIVPLSANTLAKIVNGICDNLLTSVVRAWDADGRVDGTRKRILVAPAMNVSSTPFPPCFIPSPRRSFSSSEGNVVVISCFACLSLLLNYSLLNTLGESWLTANIDSDVAPPHHSQANPCAA